MPDRLERFMARLLTDRAFREKFLADPVATGAREGLSAEQCRAVAALPSNDLQVAARSYAHKRATAKGRRAPLLRRLFGKM